MRLRVLCIAALATALTLAAGQPSGASPGAVRRVPNHIGILAAPDPVPYGGLVTVAGMLAGSGNVGREVVLQEDPFPYIGGFHTVGNPVLTVAGGTFGFHGLDIPVNTFLRAVAIGRNQVISPPLGLRVSVVVRLKVGNLRPRRGRKVTFSGTVTPAPNVDPVAIQRRGPRGWVTVASTVTRFAAINSPFSVRLPVGRRGYFRAVAQVSDGAHVPGSSTVVQIRPRRR